MLFKGVKKLLWHCELGSDNDIFRTVQHHLNQHEVKKVLVIYE